MKEIEFVWDEDKNLSNQKKQNLYSMMKMQD